MSSPNWPGSGERWQEELRELGGRARGRLPSFRARHVAIAVIAFLVLVLVVSSWYTVQAEETAVVQRFGRVVRTAGPGLHFKLPYGIERARLVPTARVLKEEFGFRTAVPAQRTRFAENHFEDESLMLTGDLNVIDVEWIVQYRIEDPVAYLFRVREPRETIRDLSEAIMRRVVGNRIASDVLTVGRVAVSSEVKDAMQQILTDYRTGVRLVTVELQDVTPPDPVKPAFNEVNEARQDRERRINEAQQQANREIPKAGGEATRTITEAEGYALERVNHAEGEAARFRAVLAEYQQARDVTRRRLYLEALGSVLPAAKTVYIVDDDQKALVPWLSVNPSPAPSATPAAASAATTTTPRQGAGQ